MKESFAFSLGTGSKHEQSKKPEQAEKPKEKLEKLMFALSQQTNRDLGYDTSHKIVDERGAILMKSYHTDFQGPHTSEQLNHDLLHVANKKLEFSGAYNLQEDSAKNKRLADWETSRQESKPELLEMAVTSTLYKHLHQDFIVMRASEFDDYANGIDNVIVDKATGNVVCAFDEVRDTDDGSLSQKKYEKISAKAHKGGAQINYGLTFNQDKQPIKTQLKNIPVFYLALDSKQLDDLLINLSTDITQISSTEAETYHQLVNSLVDQSNKLSQEKNLPPAILKNLNRFAISLEIMKQQIKNK